MKELVVGWTAYWVKGNDKSCDRPNLQEKLKVRRSLSRIYYAVTQRMREGAGGDRQHLQDKLKVRRSLPRIYYAVVERMGEGAGGDALSQYH